MKTPGFGDRVRILPTLATRALGLANRVGIIYGVTTPSITGVEILGTTKVDKAVQVQIDGDVREFWLPVDAVEVLDHSPGMTLRIGKKNLIRGRHGGWRDFKPN